jgi:transposase-like protein
MMFCSVSNTYYYLFCIISLQDLSPNMSLTFAFDEEYYVDVNDINHDEDDSYLEDDDMYDSSNNLNSNDADGQKNKANDAIQERRQSYSREYKISVINWHKNNGAIKNKTAKHFGISHQNVLRWLRAEVDILSGKKGSKRQGSGRTAMYPLLEQELYKEFLQLREKGTKVRNIWFITR